MKLTVCRKAHFNATHRLCNPNWSDDKNLKMFGACNNTNYHGHNYELTVKVKGEVDQETGMVYNMNDLKVLIKEHVLNRFDHKNLYADVDDFKDLNPTAENIAVAIWKHLRPHINQNHELSIVLAETHNNYVEFNGEF
ncbi:MAG: 6-carboxytetrahydropterin synthase [Bacteroidales bacterium]|nr:6-carboxytetrahydropterin synthase [Bacteroidales bacterium]